MSDIQYWNYIDAAGQQHGPIAVDQLQQLVAAGQVTAQTNVWTEGMAEWLPAAQIEGLIPVPVQPVAVQRAGADGRYRSATTRRRLPNPPS